ncbi:MAG: PIF1 family ATP-dependent DNA helicase [Bdellovibrionota bacterium]
MIEKEQKNNLDHLSTEQAYALDMCESGENIFLTGGAGSGKSYVVREFMKNKDDKQMPILASTGAAAVLLGGRTFHSFFGLGIMEGGAQATLQRILQNKATLKRIKKVEGVVIDEISMIPGEALMVAELISQQARESTLPWGGMRIIAVGDFGQLPPVTRFGQKRDWCFLNEVWKKTDFQTCELKLNQRIQNNEFLNVLDDIREGQLTERAREFLQDRTKVHDEEHPGTRLFPRREQSETYNQKKLAEINEDELLVDSIYLGDQKYIDILAKSAPVPMQLKLKVGCQLMFLKNDMQKRWVNGTRGTLVGFEADHIIVRKNGGREVKVEKISFSLLDADANVKASVIQFPVNLAYATTIHKSQGATLDELWCDLGALWEPGHAYVALSRLRDPSGLHIVRWSPKSFIIDPEVKKFYSQIKL